MSEWAEVAKRDEIAPGQAKAVTIDDLMIAVVNLDGEFFAVDNICTHAFAVLTEGPFTDGQLQCPLHGARFDVRTGAVTAPPAWEPLRTYEVRIDGDAVLVKI
ncbi:MAG: non-heme iron oxygenase ferredoxin subunit [Gammaproteobacteria bacterium]|jgi:3-phenylpropionate/trans-cinnamate dioxygenase ferredoxin subunit|nr:non-heme iron oxygenase ferredoxin subunit [Gammaproteobacteria bacterium]